MLKNRIRISYLCLALAMSGLVFGIAHQHGFTNFYMVNDDTRQQTYWMQQWQDPELYKNDPLTQYAKSYVPWGIKAINFIPARFINPLTFSKILAGILFVISSLFLFGLALQFNDEISAFLSICVYFLMGSFMMKISGGISQSFVFPLLIAYLYFISRDNLKAAAVTILAQSVLNPYCFLLCTVTHIFYLLHNHLDSILAVLRKIYGSFLSLIGKERYERPTYYRPASLEKLPGEPLIPPMTFLLLNVPILVGVVLMFFKYVVCVNPEIGRLITESQMIGHPEYTSAGRYELYPLPSLFRELFISPWIFNAPFTQAGPVIGWIYMSILVLVVVYAVLNWKRIGSFKPFRVFLYLAPASLLLYAVSRAYYIKLFIPGRYIEYSVNIFYCLVIAVCIRIAIESMGLRKCAVPIVGALALLGAIRLHNVGLYDFSRDAGLYNYFDQQTAKSALVAGHPELMDNVLTFGKRKVFVSYELSHTWIQPYWSKIKKRTEDFFAAYYSTNPDDVRKFAKANGIDFLVVREFDFSPDAFKAPVYFQPFDDQIKSIARPDAKFAVLDKESFPPTFMCMGIRVLKMSSKNE